MRKLILVAFSLLTLAACSSSSVNSNGGQTSHVLNNEQSVLYFLSVKNSTVAETHRFTSLSGFVSEGERAQVQINLGSVETGIPIRNERMRDHLFNIAQFAAANISVPLADHQTVNLVAGQQLTRDVSVTLDLHGDTKTLGAKVSVTRLNDGGLMVQSVAPVVVNTGGFNMSAGVEKLRELAGLATISQAVPVTFALRFDPAAS